MPVQPIITEISNDLSEKTFYLSALASLIIILTAHHLNARLNTQSLIFWQGPSMYIVAFRQIQLPLIVDQGHPNPAGREYINYDLMLRGR